MVSTGRAAQPRSPRRCRAGDTGHGPVPALGRRPVTAVLPQLVDCDNWMNINLREVICTSRDGDKFWRMPECYIRGSTIKYLRIPDEIIDMVKEEVVSKGRGRGGMQQQKQQKGRGVGGAGRGVFGGRGRGIPGSGRGQQEKKPGRQSAKQ
uniref:U6 snRNA-associated Sm-like protein LSm4 n=1 Tax=Taeniopygia guttata TaxID=59729 RepID=A0A674H193_TAEGU